MTKLDPSIRDPRRLLSPRKQQTSSALIITLLGVVLLCIVVVAFMQMMTLALVSANSYADIDRADLASRAGLEAAIAQLRLATGTNVAFVTGMTDYPAASLPTIQYPITVIGARDLTNLDQMMPLVSGPTEDLTNYNTSGFSTFFSNYTSPRTDATKSVDVNNVNTTALNFIQDTTDPNMYRATWVVMTNMVGTPPNVRTSYTRYAYVVLDDSARVNPALMTGAGAATNGFANASNWYMGPQDISMTNASAPILTAAQEQEITGASNSFGYSDGTLGQTFGSLSDYVAVKHLFTSQTNASYDVIPGWLPDGGKPKYNLNDLATNTLYGGTAMARATNIASVITRNLPNFYLRDPANKTTPNLYPLRLAANMAAYINPANAITNAPGSGIYAQGQGVFPVSIDEQVTALLGGTSSTPHTLALIQTQFWLNCWNPFTTPVIVKSAALSVMNRPYYTLGGTGHNSIPDYAAGTVGEPLAVISGSTGTQTGLSGSTTGSGFVVQPNEFVVLGFKAVSEPAITGAATTNGPVSSMPAGVNTYPPCEQYSLVVNGQVVAQSQNQGDGLEPASITVPQSPANTWSVTDLSDYGTGVGDPRFLPYYSVVWNFQGSASAYQGVAWKGASNYGGKGASPGSRNWEPVYSWINRDNLPRMGTYGVAVPAASASTELPSALASPYNLATDAPAAPYIIRNGPMVSIGELGNISDPAQVADNLTTANFALPNIGQSYSGDTSYQFTSPFQNGGARSLRIGRPEATGAMSSTGSPTASTWDTNGYRAIDLLDIFTVNNTNAATSSTAANYADLVSGGTIGRINPNTASTNVLAAVLSGIKIDSDTGMGGTASLTNLAGLTEQMTNNRPYSSLSDLYKTMPMFDASTNYSLNSGTFPTNASGYLNVMNRVHQEAFGKLIQHLTVQSRDYRVYVIGQVLDASLNPKSSVVLEAGVGLNYELPDANDPNGQYKPYMKYLHYLR